MNDIFKVGKIIFRVLEIKANAGIVKIELNINKNDKSNLNEEGNASNNCLINKQGDCIINDQEKM